MLTDYATAENTLRYYALNLLCDEADIEKGYINQSTKEEVEEAEANVQKLLDQIEELHNKQFDYAWFIIYRLAQTYQQQAMEEGIKTGIRLMVNALHG
jgi:hypothetical protein